MECRIVKIEQGSDEWLDLRRTRITCSRLADVMADPKTKRYKQYRKEKVLELLGHKNVEETPEWAQHGKEMEPRALRGYAWRYELKIEHNIFLIHKKYDWLACSPDFMHLPGFDQGGEIKCRELYKNYRKHRADAEKWKGSQRCCEASNRHQVQGAMWVTGFPFWWYVNYYLGPDMEGGQVQKVHRVAVPRNPSLIAKMQTQCIKFMKDCYETAELDYAAR